MAADLSLRAAELDDPCPIELLTDEAPGTCAAIRDAHPIEGSFVNGKFSGDEVYTTLEDDRLSALEPENWEYNAVPGDLGYWYSHWGDGRYERGKGKKADGVGRTKALRSEPVGRRA